MKHSKNPTSLWMWLYHESNRKASLLITTPVPLGGKIKQAGYGVFSFWFKVSRWKQKAWETFWKRVILKKSHFDNDHCCVNTTVVHCCKSASIHIHQWVLLREFGKHRDWVAYWFCYLRFHFDVLIFCKDLLCIERWTKGSNHLF